MMVFRAFIPPFDLGTGRGRLYVLHKATVMFTYRHGDKKDHKSQTSNQTDMSLKELVRA